MDVSGLELGKDMQRSIFLGIIKDPWVSRQCKSGDIYMLLIAFEVLTEREKK